MLDKWIKTFPFFTLILSFIAGIIFWGGLNTAMEMTNTEEFCISCHEMKDNVYMEYRDSVHFSNPTGVRATCPDCHVPREWTHKVARKIRATNELFQHFIGAIDTTEKFTQKRYELARHVWKEMKSTDSRECRNCHSESAMDTDNQRKIAAEQHAIAQQTNKTCIDCHKGIAHQLPEEFLETEHERFELENTPCYQCHAEMAHAAQDDGWDD